MKVLKRSTMVVIAMLMIGVAGSANAERYAIDPGHSFIQFSISHLGFSMLQGRFNTLSGEFNYDAKKPEKASINVTVETASIDSNHAERDKHLRDERFLDVEKYPKATFTSTGYKEQGDQAILIGDLTLHGVTKQINVAVKFVGAGDDPWGGYRRGYVGETKIKRSDFDMSYNLGPKADEMTLEFFIEGIRQ